jgi:hypothetical protein
LIYSILIVEAELSTSKRRTAQSKRKASSKKRKRVAVKDIKDLPLERKVQVLENECQVI